MNFTLKSRNILVLFSTFTFVLVTLFYSSYIFDIQDNYLFDEYFNITREKNVPTFFSFFIMILVGIVYYLLYKRTAKWRWIIISIFFIYLGFDDMFKIHEHIGSDLGEVVAEETLKTGFMSYYWQVVLVPLFAIFGLFIAYVTSREFWKSQNIESIYILIGGFFLYTIAIALDFYEGTSSDFGWISNIFYTLSKNGIVDLMRATEEAIEMLGGTFILVSLLKLKEIKISIS
jgi:hypothetical protein